MESRNRDLTRDRAGNGFSANVTGAKSGSSHNVGDVFETVDILKIYKVAISGPLI